MSMETIRADFDRIAQLSNDDWSHNNLYHDYLLRHLSANCESALEIGCGTGQFSRCLASRSRRVLALDLSPEMIRIARQQSQDFANIEFRIADVMTCQFPEECFDCVVSIATLHHLPLEPMLLRTKAWIKRGGILLVLDLRRSDGVLDKAVDVMAMPVSVGLRFAQTGRFRPRPEVRKAWDQHGRNESYSTLAELTELCGDILPGVILRKHLLWRYSLVWKKN